MERWLEKAKSIQKKNLTEQENRNYLILLYLISFFYKENEEQKFLLCKVSK